MYYVYLHKRASNKVPFYVGKGQGRRAWVTRTKLNHWNNIVNKNGLEVEIVQEFEVEDDAFLLECWLIAKLRHEGVSLCNLTDGGEGASGAVKSERERQAISQRMTGRRISEETKFKLSKTEVHIFTYVDGSKIECTQYEMFRSGRLTKTQACALVKGRRASCAGWSLIGVRVKGKAGRDNGMFDAKEYEFIHPDHGEITCTRSEMISRFGLLDSKVSLLISKKRKSHAGWSIKNPNDGNLANV